MPTKVKHFRRLTKAESSKLDSIAKELGLKKVEDGHYKTSLWKGFIKSYSAEMNAVEFKLYDTKENLVACAWWHPDTINTLTKNKLMNAINRSLKLGKKYEEPDEGIIFDGIEIKASSNRFRFSDGQIITASSKEEAIAIYKATADKSVSYEKAKNISSLLKGKREGLKIYIDTKGLIDGAVVKTSKYFKDFGTLEINIYLKDKRNSIEIVVDPYDFDLLKLPYSSEIKVSTEKDAIKYALKVYDAFNKVYTSIKESSKTLTNVIRNK